MAINNKIPQWSEALLSQCHHKRPSRTSAIMYCLSLSIAFVATLYFIVPTPIQKLSRDDPRQIKWRTLSVTFVCLGAIASYPILFCSLENNIFPHPYSSSAVNIMGWSWQLQTVLVVLFHTMLLYLGPIAENCSVLGALHTRDIAKMLQNAISSLVGNESKRWQNLRNFVTAPIAEEVVFRGCMLPVLLASGIKEARVIVLAPLFFGVAHIHHAMQRRVSGVPWKQVLIGSLFQFTYTSLFGSYVAFVLLRTGSIVSAIICHSFCNYMGLPGFYFLRLRGSSRLIFGILYLLGMAFFAVGCSWIVTKHSLSHKIHESLV